jgi:hypothetical protein
MDDVKVHYNSDKPAQLYAHAYAQGTDIHLASGQEKHLPHEAWHVVQQKQGRVQPTLQMQNGLHINDDTGLEQEADVMGAKALQFRGNDMEFASNKNNGSNTNINNQNDKDLIIQQMSDVFQRVIMEDISSDAFHKNRAIIEFADMANQLMINDTEGLWNIGIKQPISGQEAPLQMRLKVGGKLIRNPKTIRKRVKENNVDNDTVINTLISWSTDDIQTGRSFTNWVNAINAARGGGASSRWKWLIILLVVFIILLIISVPLLPMLGLPFRGSQSSYDRDSDSASNSKALIPVRDLQRIEALRGNSDLMALQEIHPYRNITHFPNSESDFIELLESDEDFAKVKRHLEAIEPKVEELTAVLIPKKNQIQKLAKEVNSDHSESESPSPLPSNVELSDNPEVRGKQILDLNKEYIAKEVDVIKIHTHALKGQLGRGHQSAAVSVMEQLAREYCGDARIEIIIDAERDAMYVFENLISGFDPKKDAQELTYNKCNFTVIRQGTDKQSSSAFSFERSVGIYPADDREIWDDDDVTNIDYSKKLMSSMGSQKLISLNPHAWGGDKRFIDTGHMTFPITDSESSIYRGGTYKDLGSRQMSPIDEVVANNIMNLVNMVKAGKVDLWATYGLHYTDSSGGVTIKDGETIANGLVDSAVYYQMKRGNSRPLIIINLSKQNVEHTKFIQKHQGNIKGTNTNLYYDEMNKPIQFRLDKGGNVIFIDMVSGIPKDWFSFIMDHSTLPIIYEGANTANLAHQMGKNFLSMRPDGDTPYVEISGFEKGRERLREAGKALASKSHIGPPGHIVSDVLLEMEDPNSEVAKYIKEVLKRASAPEADQLLMAITKLRET